MDPKNTKYIVFTIILLILSVLGFFFIFKINNSPLDLLISTFNTPKITQTPTSIPTPEPTITAAPTATSSTKISVTPTATSSTKLTITPTTKVTPTTKITPTSTPIVTVTPTSTPTASILNFKSTADGFSINYNSTRKLYQDTESSGNRYTFYSSLGNFAVHVSQSGTWSWSHPDRNFSSAFIVSNQNTFRYDISTQTIIDLQSSSKNYTIQCIHNGKATLKTECEEFIKSFQLL